MRTLKEIHADYARFDDSDADAIAEELRLEAIDWIKLIKHKSREHYDHVYGNGVLDFPTKEDTDKHFFELEGMKFYSWEEASDPRGAIMILKHFFDLTDDEVEE